MKKYKEYMDSVEASAQFQETLKFLSPPKGTAAWKKYGAMAAALALVLGLGVWAARLWEGDAPELGEAVIEQVEPGILPEAEGGDQQLSMGGYEVRDGEVAAWYMLPYIEYREEDNSYQADYSLAPLGALSRDATREDVIFMVGGVKNMVDHLGWEDSMEWGGVIWFLESGDPCAASIYAEGQDVYFFIEMMEGGEIPDCILLPEDSYRTTEFAGVKIRGLKNYGYRVDDGVEMGESRKVSFFADGIGYKLTIYGIEAERVEELASRFARWAIVEGFDLSAAAVDGAEVVSPEVGEPNYEGGASTSAYDPNAN